MKQNLYTKILTLNLHVGERNATITDIVSRYIPCLKHLDALFCDLHSFCFAYRISFFFQNEIMESIFFFCKKYLAPQINTGHHLFTLPSSPKRHPVQDAKWCNWILCCKTQDPKLHTLISMSDKEMPRPPHPNLAYDLQTLYGWTICGWRARLINV